MYVIVGLGNPDKKYEHTRHNIGFDVIDALADKYNISVTDKKHKALCGSGVIEGMKVLLVKPQTYMNLSGESVAEVMNFYKLDPDEEMIVIFDDISLEPGRIRIRKKGSAGGHNGIKSIIAMTGTQGFSRIKVGVGEKPQGWDLADHVLGRFSSCRIIRQSIELLRPLSRSYQMEYCIVVVTELNLFHADAVKHFGEFFFRHISLVVKSAPVANDKIFILAHSRSRPLKYSFLFKLQSKQTLLKIHIAAASPWRNTAAYQFAGSFGYKQHRIAQLVELFHDTAHSR